MATKCWQRTFGSQILIIITAVLCSCAGPTIKTPTVTKTEINNENRSQRVEYVQKLIQEQEKIARLNYQLAASNIDLCRGNETLTTGAFLFDWDMTSDEWVDIANEALGINLHLPGIEILFVIPGSPAESAGLLPGDRIIRLEDWRIPSQRGAFAQLFQRLRALKEQKASSIKLRVQRNIEFMDIMVHPKLSCYFPVVLQEDNSIGAFTDGKIIVVNRGMLRFVNDDNELAIVITHEIAHIVLNHIDAMRKNMVAGYFIGSVLDILLAGATGVHTSGFSQIGATMGALSYSKDFENEADYYGAHMLTRAGFDVSYMPAFWRRMSLENPDSMSYNSTHPTTAERAIRMKKTVDDIQSKQKAGLPIAP